jgi:HD-GYP domain-containing protein (c-di-GMP phosphodiesterase class II)
MLIINPDDLQEGMTLSNDFIGRGGQILLKKNSVLTQEYVSEIRKLDCNGVFIKDPYHCESLSEVENKPELEQFKTELKVKLFSGIKDLMVEIQELKKIESKESVKNISETIYQTVNNIISNKMTMVNFIDLKLADELLFYHSVNVTITSLILGFGLGFSMGDLHKLGMAAILHDIGKLLVDQRILQKKEKLTDTEFEEIKKHPLLGYNLLKDRSDIHLHSKFGVMYHHEKWNGKGYGCGLRENSINIYSQIISISDVYDALVSKRCYSKAIPRKSAVKIIQSEENKSFSPSLVELFCKKVPIYPLGSVVKLSNDWTAIVVRNYEGHTSRPVIRVFKIEDSYANVFELDLKNDDRCKNIDIIESEY